MPWQGHPSCERIRREEGGREGRQQNRTKKNPLRVITGNNKAVSYLCSHDWQKRLQHEFAQKQ